MSTPSAAVSLLVNASRTDPILREAVLTVEKHIFELCRERDDAQEHLEMVKGAWNAHMARCTSASEPVTTHDVAAPTILDQLEAAEKAATVGPWEVIPESDDGYVIGQYNERWPQPLQDPEGRFAEDDAELVILLRNHAADLIAVARAAQEYKQAHDGYRVGLHDQPRLIEDALGCLAKALAPLTEGDTK